MTLGILFKLIHVLTAFWFVAGLAGRGICLAQAARASYVSNALALTQVAGVFEKRMVIPGSSAVFLAGLVTAWAQSWPILGFLQGAQVNWLLVSLLLYLSMVPLIIFVFNPRGQIFEKAMEEALKQGRVTPELTAALRDPVVARAHAYEIGVVVAIVFLMVTKPF